MTYLQLSRFVLPFALVLAAGAAQAQDMISRGQSPADPKRAISEEAKRSARPVLPPAIPGARTDRAGAAPANDNVGLLSPTEALFDAVNRGDQAAARDALSRGADIDGHNALGLTALDLSVDLGRNDLTFLLLSLRGANPGARMAKVAPSVRAESSKGAQAAVKPAKPAGPVAARTAPPKAAQSVARYAGDPGTPAPAAGFLGFGGSVTR